MQPRMELPKWLRRKRKVRIVYKSGHVQDVACHAFTFSAQRDGTIVRAEWDGMTPNPLHLGLTQIESVWVLR